jgi:hypothetical protein
VTGVREVGDRRPSTTPTISERNAPPPLVAARTPADTVSRPSLVIAGGALLALLVAVLANELAHQGAVMQFAALTLFAAGAAAMVWLGARFKRQRSRLGRAEVSQRRLRGRYKPADGGSGLQLGRDPEKEIGRETGARV